MTVSSSYAPNVSTGNGATTVFAYNFRILAETDLEVTVDDVVQTLATHYTVSGVGADGGGDVTFVTAPANGTRVVRRRNMPLARTENVTTDLQATVLNKDQDAPVLMIQQLQEQVDRSLKYPVGETGSATLPSAAARKGYLLGFNATTGDAELSTFTMTQVASAIATIYAASSGSLDALTFVAAGVGAVPRSAQDKDRDWVSVADFGTIGVSEAADNALFNLAKTAVSSNGMLLNPRGSLVNFATVTVPNGVSAIDAAGGRFIASNVAVGESTQAGGGHLLFKDVRTDQATRLHIEPRGYPSGTKAKTDWMFDDYETIGTLGYRIRNIFTFDDETLPTAGYAFDGVKSVGNWFGIWPRWHLGFTDAGATAVPMTLYYFDFTDPGLWTYTPMTGGWRTGRAYTTNDYVLASNKLYRATTTGTAGATIPSHAAGTVSDGGVSWLFVRDWAAASSHIKPVVLFGERDDLPKGGTALEAARVQFARQTITWNNVKHSYLDGSGNICWNQYISNLTDDLYIETADGLRRFRFDATGQFVQITGLAICTDSPVATDGDTTPSVKGMRKITLNNTGATTVTAFTNMVPHQEFMVTASNSNTTLQNNANLVTATGGDLKLRSGQVLLFSVNSAGTVATQVSGTGFQFSASATYDPPSLVTGSQTTTTVTVTGVVLGDLVIGVSFSLDQQGIDFRGYVSASNTVTVKLRNDTGGTIDLASGTLRVLVQKS